MYCYGKEISDIRVQLALGLGVAVPLLSVLTLTDLDLVVFFSWLLLVREHSA